MPRAVISSLTAALIDYMTMITLVELFGIDKLTSGTAGMLAGLAFVYLAGRIWIYPPVPGKAVGLEVILFVIVSALGAGIHTLVLSLGLRFLTIHYLIIKAVASTLMFCWNFSMRRLVNRWIRSAHERRTAVMQEYSVPYPRHVKKRLFCRIVLRILLPIAFRIRITGKRVTAGDGPLILAGNHSGILEILLLIAYGPRNLELIGAGDIPLDPRLRRFTKLYGFIPVNRGNVDRSALTASVDVLKQGGFIGIFPEGGIWEAAQSSAQKGVSWIAAAADAPVVPVGIGGLHEAGIESRKLHRPVLTVGFGEPIHPPSVEEGGSRKDALQKHADSVMDGILKVIPEEYHRVLKQPVYENFDLKLETEKGEDLSERLPNRKALSLFLFRPVLLRTFRINLKLKVTALEKPETLPTGADFALTAGEILDYLKVNPHFFNYRFGADMGAAIKSVFSELKTAGEEYCDQKLRLSAERRFLPPEEGAAEQLETYPS